MQAADIPEFTAQKASFTPLLPITVYTFTPSPIIRIVQAGLSVQETEESITGGHGGGDYGIVFDMYDYLNGTYMGCSVSQISTSVANHLIGFAAEEARHNDTVVSMNEYNKKYGF